MIISADTPVHGYSVPARSLPADVQLTTLMGTRVVPCFIATTLHPVKMLRVIAGKHSITVSADTNLMAMHEDSVHPSWVAAGSLRDKKNLHLFCPFMRTQEENVMSTFMWRLVRQLGAEALPFHGVEEVTGDGVLFSVPSPDDVQGIIVGGFIVAAVHAGG